jgi:uracil phosphoribosyltransferase
MSPRRLPLARGERAADDRRASHRPRKAERAMTEPVVVDHPLVQHHLTALRRRATPGEAFRGHLRAISGLLLYEATRDLPLAGETIRTPIGETRAPILGGGALCLVAILRAGIGLLDGMRDLVPAASVAFIGIYRDPATLEPVEYYFKAPEGLAGRQLIVIDPMVATGNTATAAVDRLKARGAHDLRFCAVVAAPEGIARVTAAHPDLRLFAAAIDERLDDDGFIVPGLGDAGDRLFGTE